MTTVHDIDLQQVLTERLTAAHPDVLRDLLSMFIQTLIYDDWFVPRCARRSRPRTAHRLQRPMICRFVADALEVPRRSVGTEFAYGIVTAAAKEMGARRPRRSTMRSGGGSGDGGSGAVRPTSTGRPQRLAGRLVMCHPPQRQRYTRMRLFAKC
jgi:hypothetical protein